MIIAKENTIKCIGCGEREEFMDDGTTDCMPDGCFYQDDWYCQECCYKNGLLKDELAEEEL